MADHQTSEVLREWSESALYWQKHIDTMRSMFAPVTQALVEGAGIVAGHSVLDVAGGSGEPALTIAEIVGSTGHVTCTDAVAEMVEAAESVGHRRGVTNVSFHQCPADALPFESESFDAVTCRLGAMFFPDPLIALREMLRVTKRDCGLSLAVWGKSELNPFSYAVTNVVSRYVDVAPEDPNAPGAFRFAEPGALAWIVKNAGAKDTQERILEFHMDAPISPKEFWVMRSESSGTLRKKLASLPRTKVNLIATEVQKSIGEFFPNNQMHFPAQMIIITGRKRRQVES